jgi:hypothetical protein
MKTRWTHLPDTVVNVSRGEINRMVNPQFKNMRGVAQTLGACRADTFYGQRE